jgi:hypothetical protein
MLSWFVPDRRDAPVIASWIRLAAWPLTHDDGPSAESCRATLNGYSQIMVSETALLLRIAAYRF